MSSKLLKLFGDKQPTWIVRDQFTGTLAAGSVNGTPTSDGKGLRVVADTGSWITTANRLVMANGNETDYTGAAVFLGTPAGAVWSWAAGCATYHRLTRVASGIASCGYRLDLLAGQASHGIVVSSTHRDENPGILVNPSNLSYAALQVHSPARRFHFYRTGETGAWELIWTSAFTLPGGVAVVVSNRSYQPIIFHEMGAISLPANGDARFATDTGLATSTAATPAEAATGTHEAAYWLELNNVTRPSSGAITVNASVSGSDELTVSIAADGSIAVLENGVSRIAGAAGQITNGAIVRLRRSSATSCALFDDNSQVGATYASLAVPQGTTWAVTSLGTGGAIGAVYAWPYNVTLRGAAGRI